MGQYVKPSSDIFIKYLFGSEENKDLLLSFINAVLTEIGIDKIVNVEIKNPFNIKDFTFDKESILDVKATDENGRIYNVEVQSTGNETFVNRSLFYWAELYSGQLKETEVYENLKSVICINILEFNIFDNTNFFNSFLLKEKTSNQILTDHLIINFIELKKLDKINNKNELQEFLYFLKYEGKENKMLDTLIKENGTIGKAHKEYEKFTSDEKLRDLYNSRLKYERDKNSLLYEAEKKGKIEGKIDGKIEGKIEDAKMMKENGIDIKLISKITGLKINEIELL